MKLISMTDFVLDLQETESKGKGTLDNAINYAKFLKQPLTLGMFVPCDDDDNVFEKPIYQNLSPAFHNNKSGNNYKKRFELLCMAYDLRRSKVIFKGFEIKDRNCNTSIFKYLENGFIAPYYFNINSKKFEKNNTDLKIIEDLVPYNLDLAVSF